MIPQEPDVTLIEVAAQVLHTHGGRGSSMRRVPPPPPPPLPPPHTHSCTNHSLRQPPTMRRCTTRQRGPPASAKVTATAAFPVVLPWLTSEPRAGARSCCEPTASAKHTPSTRQDFPEPLGPTMVVVRASKGPTTTWPAKDLKSLKCTRWRSSASRVAGGRRPALSWADGIGLGRGLGRYNPRRPQMNKACRSMHRAQVNNGVCSSLPSRPKTSKRSCV
jgi:hypothetical protein